MRSALYNHVPLPVATVFVIYRVLLRISSSKRIVTLLLRSSIWVIVKRVLFGAFTPNWLDRRATRQLIMPKRIFTTD